VIRNGAAEFIVAADRDIVSRSTNPPDAENTSQTPVLVFTVGVVGADVRAVPIVAFGTLILAPLGGILPFTPLPNVMVAFPLTIPKNFPRIPTPTSLGNLAPPFRYFS
jgi:hypothetical protein